MKKFSTGLTLLTGILLAGCSDANAPSHVLSLSFAGRSTSVGASAALAAPAAPSADELVISTAQVVVRKVELKSAAEADCEEVEHSESCEEIKAGPVLVDVPTTAGASTEVTVQVPNGTYRELEFQIHKVTGNDPADATFRTAHPEFADKSIRIVGTFNGNPFLFESDFTAAAEMELDPELVVTDSVASTNLTVNFSLDDWFRTADGTLIDPTTANKGGANAELVKNNIRRALRAFLDQNRDGDEDNDHHGMGQGNDDNEGHHGADSAGHGGDSHGGHGSGGDGHS